MGPIALLGINDSGWEVPHSGSAAVGKDIRRSRFVKYHFMCPLVVIFRMVDLRAAHEKKNLSRHLVELLKSRPNVICDRPANGLKRILEKKIR